jgi:hypothetical protein
LIMRRTTGRLIRKWRAMRASGQPSQYRCLKSRRS